uniref:Uncharacterized protein n=1 Tax=viral metagenome TaxID=1070528 RepID=A0A6C0F4Y2_9ZZZZ
MKRFFNNINTECFIIKKFEVNIPITIKNLDKMYLSCLKKENYVNFSLRDDNMELQNWILEKDEYNDEIFYIKNCFKRYNGTQYLGCPNQNGQVFLYTSKNKYTKWTIAKIKDDIYKINYAGEKFNLKEVCLVVARYKENIDWVLAYNDIAIIYNKGPLITGYNAGFPFQNVINLENIGREGHTYLHHIIENYENLNSRTIFVQGSPFIHNKTILFGIDNYEKNLDVQPLGATYLPNCPSKWYANNYKKTTDYGLNYCIFLMNQNMEYFNYFDNGVKELNYKYKKLFPNSKSLVENFLQRSSYEVIKNVNVIRLVLCGLFSVTDNKIKKHDVKIYQELIKELTSFNPQGGENGYILEKLWLYIFEDNDIQSTLDLDKEQN